MKKIIIATLLITLCISVSGCGKKEKSAETDKAGNTEIAEISEETGSSADKEETIVNNEVSAQGDETEETHEEEIAADYDEADSEDDAAGENDSLLNDAGTELEYPDDKVTISFTKESKYNPDDYTAVASKGTLAEADIDHVLEGVEDMLRVYGSDDDTTEYENAYGYAISQEFYNDSDYGTRVVHSMVWSENELLDPVMQKVGYTGYEVDYYYPSGMWIQEDTNVSPVYICLYLDGNGYEYYFVGNELVYRNSPEGASYNPTTNDFINSIYKIGCYYGNTLAGEKNRYNFAISSIGEIEKKDNRFVLSGSLIDRGCEGVFVIDENTVFDNEVQDIGFQGLEDGEAFYDWYCRAYDAIENQEDWIEASALLGIWDVKTTKNHVDSVCGSYWWD